MGLAADVEAANVDGEAVAPGLHEGLRLCRWTGARRRLRRCVADEVRLRGCAAEEGVRVRCRVADRERVWWESRVVPVV
jgi:hypothetical protein